MKKAVIGGLGAAALVAAVGVPASVAAGTGPTLSVSFLTSTKPRLNHNTVVPIKIQNLGPGRAVKVTLKVTAPTWVKLVRQGCTRHLGTLACALQPLAAGASVTVRIGVTPLLVGRYSLTARASASSPPPPSAPLRAT
jgi:hypothetical protein